MRRASGLALPLVLAVAAGEARAGETLTLEQAIAMAERQHPTVEGQRAQVVIGQARSQQAVAGMLPALIGNVAYQPQTPNYAPTPAATRVLTGGRGVATVTDAQGRMVTVSCTTPGVGACTPLSLPPDSFGLRSYWTATVGIAWTPWDWGRSLYAYRSAHSAAESAEVGVVTARRNVILEVKLAFFGVVTAEEQVKVGEEAVVTFGKQLEQTRAFQRAGLRTGIDVATAESGLAGAELTLVRARAGLETARARLVLALGDDTWRGWRLSLDPATFDLAPGDETRARAPEPALVEAAFRQRTELRQLQLLGDSFRQLRRSERAGYLPQLDFSLAPSWAGTDIAALVPNLTLTIALGFPLGGMNPVLVHGQAREAEGNLRATLAQERAVRDSVRGEAVSARALLAAGVEEVVAARKLLAAATARRDLAVGRYATGIGNIIELNDAILDYVGARYQMVQAGYDLAGARAQLTHALGEE